MSCNGTVVVYLVFCFFFTKFAGIVFIFYNLINYAMSGIEVKV